MIRFHLSQVKTLALPVAAAALLAASSIGTAAIAGPASQSQSAAAWQAQVEHLIDRNLMDPQTTSPSGATASVVGLQFNERGEFQGATLRTSSGNSAVDEEALRVANRISYPALPTFLQGKPQTVAMEIHFGSNREQVASATSKARDVAIAHAQQTDERQKNVRLAMTPER